VEEEEIEGEEETDGPVAKKPKQAHQGVAANALVVRMSSVCCVQSLTVV
jgi:hypothetical protein